MPVLEDGLLAEIAGLRERLKSFGYKVSAMREAQKAYYALRRDDKTPPSLLNSALITAKTAEREVDVALKQMDGEQHAPAAETPQLTMDFDKI